MNVTHLVRRALGSVANNPPEATGVETARSVLLPAEFGLWDGMQNRDKRHSLVVLRRFEEREPGATRAERAAALLHDVGKNASNLGWLGRVTATLVGRRGARFTRYHDHEAIGARMLRGVSETRTVDLVAGVATDSVSVSLAEADDI